jgi:hypothetical protein
MSIDRVVLVVVHTVTAATRLLDVLPAVSEDPRIQILFTTPGTSAFTHGVTEFLTDIGARVIPWAQAVATRFDLALAAGHGGLHEISAPIMVMPHGAGYNKYRKPETGNRKPETGNRKPETGNRSTGLRGSNSSIRGGSFPQPSCCHTPSSVHGSPERAVRPYLAPSSQGTPATTDSWRVCGTGTSTAPPCTPALTRNSWS